jgi:hypothetical protein
MARTVYIWPYVQSIPTWLKIKFFWALRGSNAHVNGVVSVQTFVRKSGVQSLSSLESECKLDLYVGVSLNISRAFYLMCRSLVFLLAVLCLFLWWSTQHKYA